ncbi:MAG: hypothetical protein DRJ49_06100 [Thermoprotei archaeon]|nr:MAG: hypothetical protein DRJ49_06100 [Thermoprotei archaeon]
MRTTSTREPITLAEFWRKLVHVLLSMILFLPLVNSDLLAAYGVSVVQFYIILVLISLYLNVIQIRRPSLRKELKDIIRATRYKVIEQVMKILKLKELKAGSMIEEFEYRLEKIEDILDSLIGSMEREYEKRWGYIGATFATSTVLAMYTLFGEYVKYGILGLLVFDPMAAVGGFLLGRHRWPLVEATIEGSILASLIYFTILLVLIKSSPILALVTTTAVMFAEAYGVEDNISITLAGTIAAWLTSNSYLYFIS